MATTFKIAVCGPANCGKSAFMRTHATGEFHTEAIPLSQCELKFNTTKGTYTVTCVEGNSDDVDATIYMLNLLDPEDEQKLKESLMKCIGPKVLCGTKSDIKGAQTPIAFIRKLKSTQDIVYFDTSSKSKYNFEKPFLYLLRVLTCHPDLKLVFSVPISI